VAKDRAAPFSRKHRRYWLPVTGGMLLIGVVNVIIGLTIYHSGNEQHERLHLVLPRDASTTADAAGTISTGKVPSPVMNAFARRYPRTMPTSARVDVDHGDVFTIYFVRGTSSASASYRGDGTFISEQ
jgi:hypothetical protein